MQRLDIPPARLVELIFDALGWFVNASCGDFPARLRPEGFGSLGSHQRRPRLCLPAIHGRPAPPGADGIGVGRADRAVSTEAVHTQRASSARQRGLGRPRPAAKCVRRRRAGYLRGSACEVPLLELAPATPDEGKSRRECGPVKPARSRAARMLDYLARKDGQPFSSRSMRQPKYGPLWPIYRTETLALE